MRAAVAVGRAARETEFSYSFGTEFLMVLKFDLATRTAGFEYSNVFLSDEF